LDLDAVCGSIQKWLEDLEQTINPLTAENSPELKLEAGGS
jgi:hypothetical protein